MKKTPVYILLWMTFQVPDIFERKKEFSMIKNNYLLKEEK